MSTSTTADRPGSGLFLLAWGLFASAIGWGLMTDFRGFAKTFIAGSMASTSGLRRLPPWKWLPRRTDAEELVIRVRLARVIAIPFAVLGPILTVAGVVMIARGRISVPRGAALPLPIILAFIGVGVAGVVRLWWRGGFFRMAARRGGWPRVAAIVGSLGVLSFGVFAALGWSTLGIAGWMVAGLASVALLFSQRSASLPSTFSSDSPASSIAHDQVPPDAPPPANAGGRDGDGWSRR